MLYFIRHGQSEANEQGVFAGSQIDSPLTKMGGQQAYESAQKIGETGVIFDRIISSPLIRAHDTAIIIKDFIKFNGEIEIDDRLTEYNFGSLTSCKKNLSMLKSGEVFSVPEAESIEGLESRIRSFLEDYENTSENILVSAHGIVGMMAKAIFSKEDIQGFYLVEPPRNGELWKME